jgi:hypothetical protein
LRNAIRYRVASAASFAALASHAGLHDYALRAGGLVKPI